VSHPWLSSDTSHSGNRRLRRLVHVN
jgi:hypothetical protein